MRHGACPMPNSPFTIRHSPFTTGMLQSGIASYPCCVRTRSGGGGNATRPATTWPPATTGPGQSPPWRPTRPPGPAGPAGRAVPAPSDPCACLLLLVPEHPGVEPPRQDFLDPPVLVRLQPSVATPVPHVQRLRQRAPRAGPDEQLARAVRLRQVPHHDGGTLPDVRVAGAPGRGAPSHRSMTQD